MTVRPGHIFPLILALTLATSCADADTSLADTNTSSTTAEQHDMVARCAQIDDEAECYASGCSTYYKVNRVVLRDGECVIEQPSFMCMADELFQGITSRFGIVGNPTDVIFMGGRPHSMPSSPAFHECSGGESDVCGCSTGTCRVMWESLQTGPCGPPR